jgi:hypothetical protein
MPAAVLEVATAAGYAAMVGVVAAAAAAGREAAGWGRWRQIKSTLIVINNHNV